MLSKGEAMTANLGRIVLVALLIPISAEASEAPKWILLDVGLVRVTAFRPGTNQTWDAADSKPPADKCALLTLAGLATGGVGAVLGPLCRISASDDAKVQKHPPTDPDVFVKVTAGPNASYRSYTVVNTLSHVFHLRVVIPTDAIPNSGIELDVLDDDGSGDEEKQETIGVFHLGRKMLLDAAASSDLVELRDEKGGVERLELTVSETEAGPRKASKTLDVKQGIMNLADLRINAGEVVEVQAVGQYRVAEKPVSPAGYADETLRERNYRVEPFQAAGHGAAIAMIGKNGIFKGWVVAPCKPFVSPYGGVLSVGVNDVDPSRNSGDLRFEVAVRNPTAEEWKQGRSSAECVPAQVATRAPGSGARAPTEAWLDRAALGADRFFRGPAGANLASAIQRITHPSGHSPRLGSVEVKRAGEQLTVLIQTGWRGGILGTDYTTMVEWDFNQRRHITAAVTNDDAQIQVSAANKKQLDEFFRTEVYPALTRTLGD